MAANAPFAAVTAAPRTHASDSRRRKAARTAALSTACGAAFSASSAHALQIIAGLFALARFHWLDPKPHGPLASPQDRHDAADSMV